jgi:hypothetical protein
MKRRQQERKLKETLDANMAEVEELIANNVHCSAATLYMEGRKR